MCCLSKHDLTRFVLSVEIKALKQNWNEISSSVYKTEKKNLRVDES